MPGSQEPAMRTPDPQSLGGDLCEFLRSEIRAHPYDPEKYEGHTAVGGASDVLTLELPVQRPDVAVPVVELFLKV